MTRSAGNAFLYLAVKPHGGRKVGVRQARTTIALAEALRRDRLLLLKSWKLPAWAGADSTIRLRDHLALNEQLSQLLGRGVPLVEALEVAASSVRGAVKPRVDRIRELVAGGSSFADACQTVGGFDAVTVAVYRAAERTGDLGGAASQLAQTMRRRLAVSGKAVTLLIYPAIVLSISVVVAGLMLMFIVPRLGEALKDANIRLPMYSRLVVSAGGWMRANASWLALGLAAALALLAVARGAIAGLAARAMRTIPLLKDVVLAQESARFFSVMAAMVRAGVPLGDALGVSNQAVGHPALRRQLEHLRTRLVEGGILRNLIEEVTALPLATRRLLIAAERSGDMEGAFTTLAEDMTEELERRSNRLLAALEPLLIIVMFLIIGSLLMSILLPMLSLSGRAAG